MKNLVIGYGSLINPHKREKLGLERHGEVVRVQHYSRRWNVKASNKKTYLGTVPSSSNSLNAVLFPVNEKQLSMLDEHEGAYDRLRISANDLERERDPREKIWIYVPKPEWTSDTPSPDFALKRRYVDTVIEGCLFYGDAFCAEFIASTEQWEQFWYDNRKTREALHEKIDVLTGHYYPESMQILTPLHLRTRTST